MNLPTLSSYVVLTHTTTGGHNHTSSSMDLDLYCVVLGTGAATVITIPASARVSDLKRMLTAAMPRAIQCDASHLTLYAATSPQGQWLSTRTDQGRAVVEGSTSRRHLKAFRHYEIHDTSPLSTSFPMQFYGGWPSLESGAIHVLVQLPRDPWYLQICIGATLVVVVLCEVTLGVLMGFGFAIQCDEEIEYNRDCLQSKCALLALLSVAMVVLSVGFALVCHRRFTAQ